MGSAFLLTDGSSTTLYVLTGTPNDTATYAWQETTFGGGTMVYVGGQAQSTFNADTKVSTTPNKSYIVYGRGESAEYQYPIQTGPTKFAIPQRDSNGCVKTATPKAGDDAINLTYFNNQMESRDEQLDDLDMRVGQLEEKPSPSAGGWNIWNDYVEGSDALSSLYLEIGETYLMMVQAEGQAPGFGYYYYYTTPFQISDSIIHGSTVKIPLLGNEEAEAALKPTDKYFTIDDLDGGYYLPQESGEEAGEDAFTWNVTVYYKRIDADPYW